MKENQKILISNEVVADNESLFFKKYLLGYANIETKEALIAVNDEDCKKFHCFAEIFMLSGLDATDEEKNDADSLAFFVGEGVVIADRDKYFIDIKKIKETMEQYSKIGDEKSYQDDQISSGIAFTKKNQ